MEIKITGEYGSRDRTVTITDAYQIKGQTAYAGKLNGKWCRITSNMVRTCTSIKGRTVLKDFTEFEIIGE